MSESAKQRQPAPSALELAALANGADPALQVLGVKDYVSGDNGTIVTIVDAEGRDWQIWGSASPLSKDEINRLICVLQLLEGFTKTGRLSFSVAVPVSVIQRKTGPTVLVYPHLGGLPGSAQFFAPGSALAASVGKALGQLHSLPSDSFYEATETMTTPGERRSQLIDLVNQHSTVIPTDLRLRWLGALEDRTLWHIAPTPVHGSLDVGALQLTSGGAVIGMRGFEKAAVDDPALDMTWLMYGGDDQFLRDFESAYSRERASMDLHILTRAQLYAELETLKWYDQGVQVDDTAWRRSGQLALREMAEDLNGELLVPAKEEVVEIEFTAEEEPLLKMKAPNRSDSSDQQTVASDQI